MFSKSKKLELPAIWKIQAPANFMQVLCGLCNSMHVVRCFMISDAILVDTAKYIFTFDGFQNFHWSILGFKSLKKEDILYFVEK